MYTIRQQKMQKQRKRDFSLKETFSVITKNKALLCVLIAYGTDMFAFQISNSLRMYFFKYNMGRKNRSYHIYRICIYFCWICISSIYSAFCKKDRKKSRNYWYEALAILVTLPSMACYRIKGCIRNISSYVYIYCDHIYMDY